MHCPCCCSSPVVDAGELLGLAGLAYVGYRFYKWFTAAKPSIEHAINIGLEIVLFTLIAVISITVITLVTVAIRSRAANRAIAPANEKLYADCEIVSTEGVVETTLVDGVYVPMVHSRRSVPIESYQTLLNGDPIPVRKGKFTLRRD